MTCLDSPGMTAWNALVQLAADCRPKGASAWHEAGIKSAIRDLCASDRRFTFAQLAQVVIATAAKADNRTPASIGFEASWTGAAPKSDRRLSWDEGDPRYVCGICDLPEPNCRQRSATNGHEFLPRTECLPPADRTSGWMTKRGKCLQGPPDGMCQLPSGHGGDHTPTAPPPEPRGLDALTDAGAWADDRLVVEVRARKLYAGEDELALDRDGVDIVIEPLDPEVEVPCRPRPRRLPLATQTRASQVADSQVTRRNGPRSAAQVQIGSECHHWNYGPVIGLYRNREGK